MLNTKKIDPLLLISLSPLILALLISLAIFLLLDFLPTKLPLFYSLPWGDNQLATHQQFLILPAIISLITLLNLTIYRQLHESQIFFKKVLLFASLLVSFGLTITFIKILSIFI